MKTAPASVPPSRSRNFLPFRSLIASPLLSASCAQPSHTFNCAKIPFDILPGVKPSESLRRHRHPECRPDRPRALRENTLAAALLYTSGATNRLTRVDEGNTITDFDDEEIQRKSPSPPPWHPPSGPRKRSISSTRPASTFLSTTPKPPWPRPMPRWSWWTASPASKCRPKKSGASPTSSTSRAPSSSTSWIANAPVSNAPWRACRRFFGRTAVPVQLAHRRREGLSRASSTWSA